MRRRAGVGAADVVALLAIVGFLVGLLLSAIQNARAAARRTESANNLRNIGFGIHNYDATTSQLPPGCDANGFSVYVHLLDSLELPLLEKLMDRNAPVTDEANAPARRTQVRLFRSPRDPIPPAGPWGVTNYFFCAGPKASLKDNTGIFAPGVKWTIADISNQNGTARTVAMAESLRGDGSTQAISVRRQHVALKVELPARRAADAAESQQLKQWLADLESDRFATRQKASAAIEKLGEKVEVEPALRAALAKKPTADVSRRLEQQLQRIAVRQRALKEVALLALIKDDSGIEEFKTSKHIAADRGGSWMDGRFLQTLFTSTRAPDDLRPDVDWDGLGGLSAVRSLDGTIPLLFMDNHVGIMRTNMDMKVWKAITDVTNQKAVDGVP
jgi:type II secretory pathway pseudopilin PulG